MSYGTEPKIKIKAVLLFIEDGKTCAEIKKILEINHHQTTIRNWIKKVAGKPREEWEEILTKFLTDPTIEKNIEKTKTHGCPKCRKTYDAAQFIKAYRRQTVEGREYTHEVHGCPVCDKHLFEASATTTRRDHETRQTEPESAAGREKAYSDIRKQNNAQLTEQITTPPREEEDIL